MADIFKRHKLKPSQLQTVADRRLEDARFLRDSKLNARANGAMYLAGFVIELLLKARLLAKYPALQSAGSPEGLPADLRSLWSMCYRSHDLEQLLAALPEVSVEIENADRRGHAGLFAMLQSTCGEWTIFAATHR